MVTVFEYSHGEGLLVMGHYDEMDAVDGMRRYLEEIGFRDLDIEAMLMGIDISHGDRHAKLTMDEFQIIAQYDEVAFDELKEA